MSIFKFIDLTRQTELEGSALKQPRLDLCETYDVTPSLYTRNKVYIFCFPCFEGRSWILISVGEVSNLTSNCKQASEGGLFLPYKLSRILDIVRVEN